MLSGQGREYSLAGDGAKQKNKPPEDRPSDEKSREEQAFQLPDPTGLGFAAKGKGVSKITKQRFGTFGNFVGEPFILPISLHQTPTKSVHSGHSSAIPSEHTKY